MEVLNIKNRHLVLPRHAYIPRKWNISWLRSFAEMLSSYRSILKQHSLCREEKSFKLQFILMKTTLALLCICIILEKYFLAWQRICAAQYLSESVCICGCHLALSTVYWGRGGISNVFLFILDTFYSNQYLMHSKSYFTIYLFTFREGMKKKLVLFGKSLCWMFYVLLSE